MSYNKDNREYIFRKFINGDEAAYETIYYHFYEMLCVYILNYTNNHALAEDIAQESLLTLWTKKNSIKSAGALRSYLYRTAYHYFIDHYRKENYISDELEEFRRNTLNELIEENNDEFQSKLERVNLGIEALPPRCKKIFILSKQRGYSYKEIADIFGIKPKTVENQIVKAFKLIRKKVKNDMYSILFLFSKISNLPLANNATS